MTLPDPKSITIPHSEEQVADLLQDLFVAPRALIRKWAEITHQTSQARLAYPGQHLASVVSGVKGMGTAARGEDLVDSSEVKSCSKADQLGVCRDCKTRVPAWMEDCPNCKSKRINRKDDSHWIISIRREDELRQLIESKRIIFVLFDRTAGSLLDIRVRIWEVWPADERCAYFSEFVTDYYNNNYLAKRSAGLDPAPCNLHPLKFDHLMMNPVMVLDAQIDSPDQTGAKVKVDFLYPADKDRAELEPEPMYPSALGSSEQDALAAADPELFAAHLAEGHTISEVASALEGENPAKALDGLVTDIPWALRRQFQMREKRIKKTASTYRRRKNRPESA